MTNVQAAVGRVQLRRLPGLIEARRRLAADRTRLLAECEELTLPHEPDDCVHSYYLYTILVPRAWSGPVRDRLCAMLRDEYHVHTIIANPPVHSTVPYLQAHVGEVHLPISEDVGARLFCPPIQPAMSDDDNRYICAAILDAVERMKRDAPAA
jgi:perosamine synthetase